MEIIKIILQWAIPIVCATGIAFVKKQLTFNKAMKEGILSIIRSQLTSKCETYLDKGYLPEYARYCLEELFKNYKTLGGNHGMEILVEKCFELPTNKEEKQNG